MHLVAEFGSAAHALYASGGRGAGSSNGRGCTPFSAADLDPASALASARQENARLGKRVGETLGERLRRERVFVMAEGGRVLNIGAEAHAVDARGALLSDLDADVVEDDGLPRRPRCLTDGVLELNGRRVAWLDSLEKRVANGDEVRWVEEPLPHVHR